MIEVRPVEVFAGVQPRPRILLVDHYIEFSQGYPGALKHVRGKTFRIAAQQQVTYELSWILKEECYKDINLSNEDSAQKLYPDTESNLYEMIIGLKEGNYQLTPFFPADYPIYRLDEPSMSPLISSAAYKYMGAIKPSDSPVENPIFKLYLVYGLKPVILRLYVDDGVAYEKATLEFNINRCVMEEKAPPSNVTPKKILYLDEIKYLVLGGK